jgi:hypothetical protein
MFAGDARTFVGDARTFAGDARTFVGHGPASPPTVFKAACRWR